jgi:hypothetical protein
MGKRHLVKITNTPEQVTFTFYGGDRAFIEHLKTFKHESRAWIELSPYVRTRTHSQNSVYFWYIQEVSDETGMSKEEVKDFFENKFLKIEVRDEENEIRCDPETGEIIFRVRSTRELNTIEFNNYTEQIRLYCNDFFGFYLPLPNEQPDLKFQNIK